MRNAFKTAVFLTSLVAAATLSASLGRAGHNDTGMTPSGAQSDCSSRAAKIAEAEAKKKRAEKAIAALAEDISNLINRIPLMADGSAKTKLERSLEREREERKQRERELEQAVNQLAMANCY